MPADRQAILALSSDLDRAAVNAILARLDATYLQQFDSATVARHVRALLALSADNPVGLILQERPDDHVECTVLAFDHPFEFSTITGVLAGTGFSIESSDVFTIGRASTGNPLTAAQVAQPRRRVRHRDPARDAVIIDHFRGRLLGPVLDFDQWRKVFEPAITDVIALLDEDDPKSAERAKRVVNERVTNWLTARPPAIAADRAGPEAALEARIEQLPGRTRFHFQAQDAPAFLYALSTALSLHRFSIQQMRVRTPGGRAVDQIDLVDAAGQPVLDPQLLERVKLSVLLTQRFAYFVDRAPDPFAALTRFENLAEQIAELPRRKAWLQILADPRTMADLAKILGTSDYLWDDFIRLHADSLLAIFRPRAAGREIAPSPQTLPRRLDDALAGARDLAEKQDRLNEFKDRELFLAELDHILSPDSPLASFLHLSVRLVTLAENLLTAAARLVYEDLVRLFGRPMDEHGGEALHAIFGLGKLGGVALGFASDLELLFVYAGSGQTAGGERAAITTAEFFARLACDTSAFISAKREGIFHVDLTLRPYGANGPLACSREQFEEYYGPSGAAHPFEKLALVRLRWFAGDAKLGFEIEQLRDRFIYDGPPLDLDALWALWTRLRAQRAPGQFNPKHSPGGLADLEGAVQLLQIAHAHDAPQLRTPRLYEAIEGLRRAGVLSPQEFEDLIGAHQFIRRLINAQRMLRGMAADLLLPPAGSDELLHLARRMGYSPTDTPGAGAALLDEFTRHASAVRAFIRRRFGRECPGA